MVNPETDEADFTEYKKRLEQCFRQYVEKSSAPDFVDTLSPEHLLAVLTGGGAAGLPLQYCAVAGCSASSGGDSFPGRGKQNRGGDGLPPD